MLTLTGAASYAGGTTVEDGTLQLGTGGSLPSTGTLTVNGGSFDLNGNNLTVAALAGAGGTVSLGSGMRVASGPPRLPALRRRAASTRTWRMARAAMRLKCRRDVDAKRGEFASFSHASLTSAVGLSVNPWSPRFTLEASRRSSS